MIIVSQDKLLTTESLALSIESIENKNAKKIMVQEHCGKLYLLGIYKTEERAKEILEEIIEQYEYCQRLQEGNAISLSSGNNYVYKMPKE